MKVTIGEVPVNNVYRSTDSTDFIVFQVSVGSEYEFLLYEVDGQPTLHLYAEGIPHGGPSMVSFDVPPDFAHVVHADKGTLMVVFFRRPMPFNSRLVWVRDST